LTGYGYLFFECELVRVLDDFAASSLIIGRIVGVHVRPEAMRQIDADDHEMIVETPLLA